MARLGRVALEAGRGAKRLDAVGALPGEVVVGAAEVPVGGGLLEDRSPQVEVADDRARAQVEGIADDPDQLGAGKLPGAEGLDHQRHRVGDADRVCDLDLAPIGEAGRDHVLGHVAGGVGARPVHLGGILAGEAATTVASGAAVGVDDHLAPGQTAVPLGAADHELPGRVDEEALIELLVCEQLLVLLVEHRLDHVLPQVGLDQRLAVDVRLVLGGDQDASRSPRGDCSRSGRSPGSCRRGAGTGSPRPCGPRPGGGRSCARSGSASASGSASPGSRSRTSFPGRRRRSDPARPRRWDRCAPRRRCSRPGRCRAIARRSP